MFDFACDKKDFTCDFEIVKKTAISMSANSSLIINEQYPNFHVLLRHWSVSFIIIFIYLQNFNPKQFGPQQVQLTFYKKVNWWT